jgi:ligand-binding SRPBCC domain-containing protein
VTATFSLVTDLPVPPTRAFDWSLDVDAHTRSLAGTGERAVEGVTSGRIGLGETVTFRARHLGVVWRLTSRITAVNEPDCFVDEQVRGPFAAFHHEHRFEARVVDGRPGTRMTDTITYRAPFGPLGLLAERLVLTRHLRRTIATRNAAALRELH